LYTGRENEFNDLPAYVSLSDIDLANRPFSQTHLSFASNSSRPFNDRAPQPNITQHNPTQQFQCTPVISHPSDDRSFHDEVPSRFDAFQNPPVATYAAPQSFQSPALSDNSPESSGQAHYHDPARYYCPYCSRSYDKKYQLTKHLKRHERPCPCTYEGCPDSFSENKDLKRHIDEIHLRKRDYSCDGCMRSFSRADNLRRHQGKGCRRLKR